MINNFPGHKKPCRRREEKQSTSTLISLMLVVIVGGGKKASSINSKLFRTAHQHPSLDKWLRS